MLCLGIETSCDETALALIKDGQIVNEVLASQAELHSLFGGVVPELASREHLRFIGRLFDILLESTPFTIHDINYIAIARGPGLLGSLLVGNSFAKSLALGLSIPIIGVNHLYAHLLVCLMNQQAQFPALGLIASGGHTHLYLINDPAHFVLLGRSLDDACGEAFDKTGTMLGFPYPAGKFIDKYGNSGNGEDFLLPTPYLQNENLDFSFSGLKTAAIETIKAYNLENSAILSPASKELANFCYAFNYAATTTLIEKTIRALEKNKTIKALWLAGGVAANTMIRDAFKNLAEKNNLAFLTPPLSHCTDNATMIAFAGWLLASKGYFHELDYEIIPRGKKIPEDMKQCDNKGL